MGRRETALIKSILFGSFWSFLLVLSGIADLVLGLFFGIGILSVNDPPVPMFIICLAIGFIYLAAGIFIGALKSRKQASR